MMNNLKTILKRFSRPALVGLLIFIEYAIPLFLYFYFFFSVTLCRIAVRVLSFLCILLIIGKKYDSSFTLSWCILICLLPAAGSWCYAIFGNSVQSKYLVGKISKNKVKVPDNYQKEVNDESSAIIDNESKRGKRSSQTSVYLANYCGYPAYSGSSTRYFKSGEDTFNNIISELRKAERFVFIEFFIVEDSRLFDKIMKILGEKAKSGVDVRLIYDDFGSVSAVKPSFAKEIEQKYEGVRCLRFNPFVPVIPGSQNCRDHRKVVIIDGEIAYSGGLNIADRYINIKKPYGYWKDSGFRISGRAVDAYTRSFISMWNSFRKDKIKAENYIDIAQNISGSGFIQPFFDTPGDGEHISKNVMLDIINKSQNYLCVFTPYLIPDDALLDALSLAVKRGVDVIFFDHGIPDKKIVYRATRATQRRLLALGAHIFRFNEGFIHSKVMMADGKYALLGTANMDYRSLYLSFESGLYIQHDPVIDQIESDFSKTSEKCVEVTANDLKENIFMHLFDSLVALVKMLF